MNADGGGLANCNGNIVNCVIAENTAVNAGAILGDAVTTTGSITNCTIANNTADIISGLVGGVKDYDGTITNTILWDNVDSGTNVQDAQIKDCAGAVTYSCIQDGTIDGSHFQDQATNIDSNPLFMDTNLGDGIDYNGSDDIFGTVDDGLNLKETSDCRDSGSNATVETNSIVQDITTSDRKIDGDYNGTVIVDIGAYEGRIVLYATSSEDLCNALSTAVTGSEIWVAEGTYYPDVTQPDQVFRVPSGVKLIGGFHLTELGFQQRDPLLNPTILSGDIGIIGDISDNANYVVIMEPESVIDGFFIQDGSIGIACPAGNQSTIKNSVIQGNQDGIVIYVDAIVTIQNNVIRDNTHNGILSIMGKPVINNNAIYENSNGIDYIGYTSESINNNTVARNYCSGISSQGCAEPVIANCILWGNGIDLINCTASYSCFADGTTGIGNISTYPHFIDAENGDFRLKSYSPCIDAGDSSDFSYEPEDNGDRINMGVYGNTLMAQTKSPDSDADGLPDDWEMKYLGRLDLGAGDRSSDTDNLTNLEEYQNGTDPTSEDTDEDGLTDDWEISNGLNPLNGDTDRDGMADQWEFSNGLNPLSGTDASMDPDGDGMTNLDEFTAGTDIHNVDTDNDGLVDGASHIVLLTTYQEGISLDGIYVVGEATVLSDPTKPHTDTDGFVDGIEVLHWTDPADSFVFPESNIVFYIKCDVASSGSGLNWQSAYKYIQRAIDWAIDGDTIKVDNGIYSEQIDLKGKILRITSEDDQSVLSGLQLAQATIINAQGQGTTITFNGNETEPAIGTANLEGFTITGGYPVGGQCGGGIRGNGAIANIQRCIIRDNISQTDGGGVANVDGALTNCFILSNDAQNASGGGLAGCDGEIVNCVVAGNKAYAGGGLITCNGQIVNCTIADNTATVDGGGCKDTSGIIANSIVWDNTPDSFANSTEPVYSCVEGSDGGIDNIMLPPNFAKGMGHHALVNLRKLYSVSGPGTYVNLITDCQVLQTDTDLVYSTELGNWLPSDTNSQMEINVVGEKDDQQSHEQAGFIARYRIWDHELVSIQSNTWGSRNLAEGSEPKLTRTDTFQRQSDNIILINGFPYTIAIGAELELQRETWTPSDNGDGYSYISILNMDSNYFDVKIHVWENDAQYDDAFIAIDSYIKAVEKVNDDGELYDYKLTGSSPCVNAGKNSLVPVNVETDIVERDRFVLSEARAPRNLYALEYLESLWSETDGPWNVLIEGHQVLKMDDYVIYSTELGNWLPSNTNTAVRLNVDGERNYAGDNPRAGIKAGYRIWDNIKVTIQSNTSGGKNLVNEPEPKLTRTDTFQRLSDNQILINGTSHTIAIGSDYEVERKEWIPYGNGSGYSYLKVCNRANEYFDVEICVWEKDVYWDNSYVKIDSYINAAPEDLYPVVDIGAYEYYDPYKVAPLSFEKSLLQSETSSEILTLYNFTDDSADYSIEIDYLPGGKIYLSDNSNEAKRQYARIPKAKVLNKPSKQQRLERINAFISIAENRAPGMPLQMSKTPSGYLRFAAADSPLGLEEDSLPSGRQSSTEEIADSFMRRQKGLFADDIPQLGFTRKKTEYGIDKTCVRYRQQYAGIPIFGAESIVHVNNRGAVVWAFSKILRNARLLQNACFSSVPDIELPAAQTRAIEWAVQEYGKRSLEVQEAELMIFDPSLLDVFGSPKLVWKMIVFDSVEGGVRHLVMIDAKNGQIAFNYSLIYDSCEDFTSLDRDIYDCEGPQGSFWPRREEGDPPVGVADVDNVYDYVGDSYLFYCNQHDYIGLSDWGQLYLRAYVRENLNNAYYQYPSKLVFGNGWAADDIVAHEYTHGVTEYTSKLIYYGQSGAINESLSDMWGEWIDQNNGRGNDASSYRWKVGEDSSGGTFRDMKNPLLYGDPEDMDNYVITGYDNGGVHTNSGIRNKLCYLLTDGGFFNGQTVTGLGFTAASDLFYLCQRFYLAEGSSYSDLDIALTSAAQFLGFNVANVQAACEAVKIHEAVEEIPWLDIVASERIGTISAQSSINIPLDFSSETMQLGVYTADLIIDLADVRYIIPVQLTVQ